MSHIEKALSALPWAGLAALGAADHVASSKQVQEFAKYLFGDVVEPKKKYTKKKPSKRRPILKKDPCFEKYKKLKMRFDSTLATHIHRLRKSGDLVCTVNGANFGSIDVGGTLAQMEAATANFRYFDANTNTLVTKDPSVGTYHRDLYVKSIRYHMRVRNNYQVPVRVTMYACRPKMDTSQTPGACVSNGLADQGNPTITSTLIYPTDSELMKDLWVISKKKTKLVQPGDELELVYKRGGFRYSFATGDQHNLAYQKDFNGFSWLIRLEGPVGHDTANTTEQGSLAAGIDYQGTTTFVFEYDAGKDLKDFSVDDDGRTFTNNGVTGNKPVADNQIFSIP